MMKYYTYPKTCKWVSVAKGPSFCQIYKKKMAGKEPKSLWKENIILREQIFSPATEFLGLIWPRKLLPKLR
jgi:hypothetical protein